MRDKGQKVRGQKKRKINRASVVKSDTRKRQLGSSAFLNPASNLPVEEKKKKKKKNMGRGDVLRG